MAALLVESVESLDLNVGPPRIDPGLPKVSVDPIVVTSQSWARSCRPPAGTRRASIDRPGRIAPALIILRLRLWQPRDAAGRSS
jgi:hypothetical protein